MLPDFQSVFIVDFESGRLFWRAPPKNHAQRRMMEAGSINNGRWPSPAIDHVNGNSLDDRISNLRECTLSQNAANSRRAPRHLPQGVHMTRQGRYMARMTVRGMTASLGTFDTAGEAEAVYLANRKRAFGEYA